MLRASETPYAQFSEPGAVFVPSRAMRGSRRASRPRQRLLDAAISLYGQHDVSAISAHAAPVELIDRCSSEVAALILRSKQDQKNRVIFVSGAPGAGKTLVGLKLAFDPRFRDDAVFVTGNAPLVDVLSAALQDPTGHGVAVEAVGRVTCSADTRTRTRIASWVCRRSRS